LPNYLVTVAKRCLPKSKKYKVMSFTEATLLPNDLPVKSFSRIAYTNLSTHMTDHAFRVIVNTDVEDKYKNYLPISTKSVSITRFEIPEKTVIIPTGYTAKVREMKAEITNDIIDFIVEKGYTPVFLGKDETDAGSGHTIKGTFSTEINFDKGIDLRNQTSMLETIKIIQESSGIVGLDNGLLHLAGTTDIPIVGGFTTVKPEHRLPYRNDILGDNYYPVVVEDLPCNFCQSNMLFTFKHNFTKCIYGDYKCCDLLSSDKYIEQLDLIL
jgi:ADP-heptose:LPS heptosyltransferase